MIKSLLVLVLFVFAQFTFAITPKTISLNLPELKYASNKGAGIINSLSINLDAQSDDNYSFQTVPAVASPAKIVLARENKILKMSVGPVSLVMQNINGLLTKLDVLDIKKLEVSFGDKNQHFVHLGSADLSHASIGEMAVEGLQLNCQHKKSSMPDIVGLIDECLLQSTVQAERLEIPDMNSFWMESLFNIAPLFEEFFQTFKDFEAVISQGNFDLSLKIKGLPLARVKGEGHIKPDLAKKKVTIRVDKVKFGLLPVTDLVMSQLKKKLPPENFRVDPPYIYASW